MQTYPLHTSHAGKFRLNFFRIQGQYLPLGRLELNGAMHEGIHDMHFVKHSPQVLRDNILGYFLGVIHRINSLFTAPAPERMSNIDF